MTNWLSPGNTAVITGGASGIGLAAAERFAGAGMNVVLADLDQDQLAQAESSLASVAKGSVDTFVTDVSEYAAMESLRDFVLDTTGAPHCLMNNAGTSIRQTTPWEDLASFKRQIEINFWGVVHGCHAFLPHMLADAGPAAVINTGSKQGLTKPPGNYAYNISKTSVIAYTESVAYALRQIEGCAVSAHLLIPGFTYTGMISKFLPEKPDGAWVPEEVVQFMLHAIENKDFYILCPDNETPRELDERRLQWNADDIISNRPALSRWHPEFSAAYQDFVDE